MGFVLDRPAGTSFSGLLFNNDFSDFLKAIIGFSAAAALLLSKHYFESEKLDRYEFSVLTLYSVLGMSIMVSANNLLSMYIGIEMLRGGPQIFRPWRLVFGTSALRRITGLWFHRGFGFRNDPRFHCDIRLSEWCGCRHGILVMRVGVQDLCRAVPYVDAGCL